MPDGRPSDGRAAGRRAGADPDRRRAGADAPAFIRRQIPLLRAARRGGPGAHRGQGRPAAGRGRHRGPRRRWRCGLFRDAGATVDGAAGALRSRPRAGAVRDGAVVVHPARPQPGPLGGDRRRRRRVRPGLRLAVRPRPGRRPPLRLAGRLRELRQADVGDAVAAPLRRHGVRAGRRAGQQAAPRHGVRPPALQRQADDGLGHRAEPGRGLRRDGPHRLRRRRRRGELRHPRQRQRQLAAGVGRGDDRRDPRLRRRQPGAGRRAVHPRRGDGAGDARRRHRPGPRRDDGRRRPRPAHPAGLAGDLRQLPVVDGAALGLADVRDAGAGDRLARRRPAGPPGRLAAALLRRVHVVQGARRPGDARVGGVDAGGDPVRRQLHPPLGRLAGGRAGDGLREVRRRRRLLRRAAPLPRAASTCPTSSSPWTGSARSARASTSSAPSTRCATTRRRSGTAGWPTALSFEQWRDGGERRVEERAADKVAELLADYEPPPIDDRGRRGAA